jgi:hypothetical protein
MVLDGGRLVYYETQEAAEEADEPKFDLDLKVCERSWMQYREERCSYQRGMCLGAAAVRPRSDIHVE